MPQSETPLAGEKANMSPGKADPTGHELDHISHIKGVGHDHDSIGFQNGIGHAKFHDPDDDDHDHDDDCDCGNEDCDGTDCDHEGEPPVVNATVSEEEEIVAALFNQPPLPEDMPGALEDEGEAADIFDLI